MAKDTDTEQRGCLVPLKHAALCHNYVPMMDILIGSLVMVRQWRVNSLNAYRTIRIWDVQEGRELRRLDRNMHTAPITSIRWHPNGALVATTSADNTTVLWVRTVLYHFWLQSKQFPDVMLRYFRMLRRVNE